MFFFAFYRFVLFSHECSADVALYYLEIFEDDVDSAVTAFLESGPVGKQDEHAPKLVEETDGTAQEQPQLSPQLEDIQGRHPQAQWTLSQRDHREEQQAISSEHRGDEMFFTLTVHNHFKFDHTAAERARVAGLHV